MDTVHDAVELLNNLIDSGKDYPDAEFYVLKTFNISQDDLKEAYEDQFVTKLSAESLDDHAVFMGWK